MTEYITLFFAVVWTGLLPCGVLLMLISPMLFDDPASYRRLSTRILFYAIVAFPLLCVLSLVSMWWLHKGSRPFDATMAGWPPLLSLIGIFVASYLERTGR